MARQSSLRFLLIIFFIHALELRRTNFADGKITVKVTLALPGYYHGSKDSDLGAALVVYRVATPGVRSAGNVTVILGANAEPQPDRVLFIDPVSGGQAKIEKRSEKNYLVGGPELVAEISHSSVALDLHQKREDNRIGGVREYIVV